MECDNQFKIKLVRNGVQLFYVNTSTLTYKDTYEFGEAIGETNVSNPFTVNVNSYNVSSISYADCIFLTKALINISLF